jgi:hypothetical protein
VLADVTGPPLRDCLDGFFSPGLSTARLRALPPAARGTPDLLLRMFEPPQITVRGRDLAEILAPAYRRLADPDGGAE